MCGITGFACKSPTDEIYLVKDMSDAIRHRGPDDEGYTVACTPEGRIIELGGADSLVTVPPISQAKGSGNVALGHRRLSILDTSPAGHQPMSDERRSVWIVFNGEIYNYLEIRSELESEGFRFKSGSDTEVLLQAYRKWGEDCLSRLNGMWAFAILDLARGVLFCARDRFGVKPFYYWHDSTRFAFASEIKALFRLPFVSRKVNQRAALSYLLLGRVQCLDSELFSGVETLGPSMAMRVGLEDLAIKVWRYYELPATREWEGFSVDRFKDHVDQTRIDIVKAVGLRLRSDVPVGSCLSGGIDSSSIVVVINDLLKNQRLTQVGFSPKVFTACYDDHFADESGWAEIVVRATNSEWHKTFPESARFKADLEPLIWSQDVPFASTSIYAQYRVIKLAQEKGVKVLLDGQGGDELFTGYPPYYEVFFYEMIRRGEWGVFASELASLGNSPMQKKGYLGHLLKRIAIMYSMRMLPNRPKAALLKGHSREHSLLRRGFVRDNASALGTMKERFHRSLNEMLFSFMTSASLETLLRYEDRNSMHFSIESRTPFADDIALIERVFSIPAVYKIHMGWSKALLREAMRGLLPEKIRLRKDKIGFATPEKLWISDLKSVVASHVNADVKKLVDTDGMLKNWEDLVSHAQQGPTVLWRYINFIIWQNLFDVSF